MSKLAVYTSLFGGKDNVIPVPERFRNEADWFMFTNLDVGDCGYTVINADTFGKSNRRASREYKLRPHVYLPDYDYHLYIDASIELLVSPAKLIKTYLKNHDIAVLKHPWRNCIYDEMKECLRIGVADWKLSHEQAAFYRKLGYPDKNGLTENGVLLRRNNERVRMFDETWNLIYNIYAERDQFSFCFVSWLLGVEYAVIDTVIRTDNADMFHLKNHLI